MSVYHTISNLVYVYILSAIRNLRKVKKQTLFLTIQKEKPTEIYCIQPKQIEWLKINPYDVKITSGQSTKIPPNTLTPP